jgi:hypothetical protein
MAESIEHPIVVFDREEPAVPAAGHVLEEHALDRIAGAELEDLLEAWFDEWLHLPILASSG